MTHRSPTQEDHPMTKPADTTEWTAADADTTFRTDLKALRDGAHALWQRARTAEEAAFELYRGEHHEQREAWQVARDVVRNTSCAYEQLQRAYKATAAATAGATQ